MERCCGCHVRGAAEVRTWVLRSLGPAAHHIRAWRCTRCCLACCTRLHHTSIFAAIAACASLRCLAAPLPHRQNLPRLRLAWLRSAAPRRAAGVGNTTGTCSAASLCELIPVTLWSCCRHEHDGADAGGPQGHQGDGLVTAAQVRATVALHQQGGHKNPRWARPDTNGAVPLLPCAGAAHGSMHPHAVLP